jgi:hypothetical protein
MSAANIVIEELLKAMDKLVYKDYSGHYLTAFHGDSIVTEEVEWAIELAKEYLKTEGNT